MNGIQAEQSARRWQRARQRQLWRRALSEPLEPQLPQVGAEVGGLRLEARLGAGGFGTVYRARSRSGKPFAVKFIHLPRAAAWAWRELEVLLRLRRIGWVAVRGHGEWPEKAPRFVYLVMEYVQGWALDAWARRRNPTARQVAELVRALARQLTAVHRVGVVHRDVKCANVVVREKDGRPVLVDFGVGTFPGAHPVTGPLVPGTSLYRSPELEAHRRRGDERSEASAGDDLWALGVLLYWLLTGGFPFDVKDTGDTHADARALGEAILHHTPEAPHVRNPRVPEALAAVCLSMLEKAPGARYPDAQAVEAALTAAPAGADAAWDVPLCMAWGPDSTTTEAEGELEDEQEEARWRRLEDYERRHPRRGEPSTPQEPATPAPPTLGAPPDVDAPPTPDAAREAETPPAAEPPRAWSTPWRWAACAGLVLALGWMALWRVHRAASGSATELPEVTAPVASALPTPEVGPGASQEVAPGGKRPEGDGGAAPPRAATPAPVARATPSQDTRVKTPAKAPAPPQPQPPPKGTSRLASTVGGLVLTSTLATSCTGTTTPQVRPAPPPAAECPPGAVQAMEKLGLFDDSWHSVKFAGSGDQNVITVRPGPGATLVNDSGAWRKLPGGTVFSGELIFGEDHVYGRFTQAHTPEGHTYPVCMEAWEWAQEKGLKKRPGSGQDTARVKAYPYLQVVEEFE